MRHFWALLFCLVVCGYAVGQESRVDLFGGYSYVNIDTNGLSDRQNANGWEAAVAGNFTKWFAVEGDVSGYYKSYGVNFDSLGALCLSCEGSASLKVTDYAFAGGPRINFKPFFAHALFGGDHLTGTASATVDGASGSISASQNGFAGLAGGGVQWKVSGPWSVRGSADYVFTRHNIFDGSAVTQNNYRVSVGMAYSFGGRHASPASETAPVRKAAPAPTTPPAVTTAQVPRTPPAATAAPAMPKKSASADSLTIASLGVAVRVGRNPGAEIIDAEPNSVVAAAGIHAGDVINAVDGKAVSNPMELENEISGKAAGSKVKIGFLLRGIWQSESVVVIP